MCHKPHNSLLHLEQSLQTKANNPQSPGPSTAVLPASQVLNANLNNTCALLPTICLFVKHISGEKIRVRCILDTGSEINIITQKLVNSLGINTAPSSVQLTGVNGININGDSIARVSISNESSSFSKQLSFVILDKITNQVPSNYINPSQLNLPVDVTLSDPQFYIPGDIDMLIGVGSFFEILRGESISLGHNLPVLQNSVFGWFVCGLAYPNNKNLSKYKRTFIVNNLTLNKAVSRFWEIEEIDHEEIPNLDDRLCEENFVNNVTRNINGRYTVALPLKPNASTAIGKSLQQAKRRFLHLESRLNKNENLKRQYCDFINEYIKLGHAYEVPNFEQNISQNSFAYYLPHHAVFKNGCDKIRVVFDASAKTSTGISLNDVLYTGQKLQQDIFTILLRFRSYNYVMTADIVKMFRQIRVKEEHQDLQRILWRENVHDKIKCFNLSTVTYGTACAPYLAIRCLNQLVLDEGESFPLASRAVQHDCYVDDIISGANSLEEAIKLKEELIQLLIVAIFNCINGLLITVALLIPFPYKIANECVNLTDNKNN
ncbi:uncharacterized protein LOC113376214 [Ctenocephalides felis]|uniref:uncharacterized protein LOC113376214 n=1 Tax=Ctenocephalides felis TaxID=7515 RepID=UPI000E6E40EB|nr:uncharacterized protein LOC113376214 [Ctenocephalides felis]